MKVQRLIVFAGLVGVAAGTVAVIHLKAQQSAAGVVFDQLSIDGVQDSPSSPFVIQGTPIGNHGTWQRTLGPALGSPFGTIPSVGTFLGGDCRAEYSEFQIVTASNDTLNVSVWGYRCEPLNPAEAAAGAHITNGVYTIESGTGAFRYAVGGAGSIQINARPDGSTVLRIFGSIVRKPAAA